MKGCLSPGLRSVEAEATLSTKSFEEMERVWIRGVRWEISNLPCPLGPH